MSDEQLIPLQNEVYTVAQLNCEVRYLIEEAFQTVWVLGEISNLSTPSSGHMYFSLKDSDAQVRCALFRMSRRKIGFTPENGQQVLVHAQVSLYEARGDYQLIVTNMQLAGEGALQIAFEKLKQKLQQEGLFDEEHKQELMEFPEKIGVVTSATGAAIRDILTVLRRRFPSIPVIIYPTLVQGDQAAAQISHAIDIANQRNECDVLIVARGGGSLEDLWPFNEEIVARAIFASEIPIVTGVGHEVDTTIADFVADERAATPSAAAEIVSPDRDEWLDELAAIENDLYKMLRSELRHLTTHLNHLQKRLRHPGQLLREQAQRLDQLEQRLLLSQKNLLGVKVNQLTKLQGRFNSQNPQQRLRNSNTVLQNLKLRLQQQQKQSLKQSKQQLDSLSRALDAISPLKTLDRGYAIVSEEQSHSIITDASQLKPNDQVITRFAKGSAVCTVNKVDNR